MNMSKQYFNNLITSISCELEDSKNNVINALTHHINNLKPFKYDFIWCKIDIDSTTINTMEKNIQQFGFPTSINIFDNPSSEILQIESIFVAHFLKYSIGIYRCRPFFANDVPEFDWIEFCEEVYKNNGYYFHSNSQIFQNLNQYMPHKNQYYLMQS